MFFTSSKKKFLNGARLLVKAVANQASLAHLRMAQF